MDTPLRGYWLFLYRVWLFAPLLVFAILWLPYAGSNKSVLVNIALIVFLPLLAIAIPCTKEYHDPMNVTPRRLLVFFGSIFLGIVLLVLAFAIANGDVNFLAMNWKAHFWWTAAITPGFTLFARFYLPRSHVTGRS